MRLPCIAVALLLLACGSGDKEHLRLAASAYMRADEADGKNFDSDVEFDAAIADFEKAVDAISDDHERLEIGRCGTALKTFRTVRHTAMLELHTQELRGQTVTDADAKKVLSRTDQLEPARRECFRQMLAIQSR